MQNRTIQWTKWEDPFHPPVVKRDDDDGPAGGVSLIHSDGVLPFQESTMISARYNLWVGHANFKLSHADIKRIAGVNGVETLNSPTRHRFRVGVGTAFDENEVKAAITDLFTPKEKQSRPFTTLLSKLLAARWKFWAIVRGPDGRLSSLCSNEQKEISQLLKGLDKNLEVVERWA